MEHLSIQDLKNYKWLMYGIGLKLNPMWSANSVKFIETLIAKQH